MASRPLAVSAFLALVLLVLPGLGSPAAAEPRPSSDLLLPFFEVDLDGDGRTTLFAVVSRADEPLVVRAAVYSNWGVEVVAGRLELAPGEVATVNLRDWLADGELPGRRLGPAELAHVQAALSGRPSPRDGLYYGTELVPGRAVGYVTLRLASSPRHDALWGDYFWVDPGQARAEAELLVDIDRTSKCPGLCKRHLLRFLEGGGFDGGTELVIWSSRFRTPAAEPHPRGALGVARVISISDFQRESGETFDRRELDLLPVDLLSIAELALDELFGWLEIVTEEDVYVGVRYASDDRFRAAIQSWCLDDPPPPRRPRRPGISLQKATNGDDADSPPGPNVPAGQTVVWEYLVTNTGRTRLASVAVTDDVEGAVACPASVLDPGEAMLCTLLGVAADQGGSAYRNVGTVTARAPDGTEVEASDPSHYFNQPIVTPPPTPSIALEKFTNGADADSPPGPTIAAGDPVTWHYVVVNDGPVPLVGVAVDDDLEGAVACPQATLAPGESMVCVHNGVAADLGGGVYANLGTARGTDPEGTEVSATDPSHHTNTPPPPRPAIDLEKATNGEDADLPPGPVIAPGDPVTWTYRVENTGDVTLAGVAVTDDRLGPVSCPQTTLAPGESMTCTATGTAGIGPYRNEGWAEGTAPDATVVEDHDPSHYHNTPTTAGQGCTPGYWKNHPDSWPATGYTTGQLVQSVFASTSAYPAVGGATLLDGLSGSGGPTLEDAVGILVRAAVAALLDAAHPGVAYPRTEASVIADVDAAVATADRPTILALAAALDADNNLGCPLS